MYNTQQMSSALEWVKTKDPNGKEMWVNQKTFETSYARPYSDESLLQELRDLSNRVIILEKRQAWIRVTADKSVVEGNGLKIEKVDTSTHIFSFLFEVARDKDNYGVVTQVHNSKYYRTWSRVANITSKGFEVHLLTEKGEPVIGVPDLEITCLVCG
eukprot:Phypoly_transcript_16848.p1 GENE.Phypoly_transcript_16848~~Phypoly_transcript_16848.p1  ORF type:complete len:157 (+),score=22.21 Phypoly_transcript_16848:343-813(+)